jgi:flavin reductase (DIM6/NTAB) family NADH-FMN oxidoreductase RutF
MERMRIIDAKNLTAEGGYSLLSAIVVPRPIAWITSIDKAGRVNAAPFSCFTYVSNRPPMIAINIGRRNGELKDTARNLREGQGFVVNAVPETLIDPMHRSSFDYASDISEPEVLGLKLAPSSKVAAPRLADAPIALECHLHRVFEFGEQRNELVIGEVVAFCLSENVYQDGRIDMSQIRSPGRIGGPNYVLMREIMTLPEMSNREAPVVDPPAAPCFLPAKCTDETHQV